MLTKLKPKSEFSRNVLTLMTGTTIAQAIPIAISPILTRIYTPEDFGMFALYMSVASILSVVATGRYELAIMLPKKDEDAINIVALSIMISFFVSFITLLIVFFFNAPLTSLLGNPEISAWLYFIPLTVLLTGIYQSFNYWSNRKKEYKRLATSRIIQSGTTASSNLGMGFGGSGGAGLIGSSILGQGVASFVLGRMILNEESHYFSKIKKLKIYALSRRYIKFPTWNLFSSFISTLRENILIFAFSKYFELSFLGFYFFAKRLLLVPSGILVNAFSDVFYQKISKITLYSEIYNIAYAYFRKLFYILTFPFILFVLLLDTIIPIVFGEEWATLSIYLLIISFPIYFNILLGHFSKILLTTDNQDVSFYFHLAKLIALFSLLAITIGIGLNSLQVLISVSIFEIFFILFGIIVIQYILKVKENQYLLYLLSLSLMVIEVLVYNKI